MIIVHDIFICKPGNASKVAKLFKEVMKGPEIMQIMTDVTGQFNKVMIVSQYENLTAYEKAMQEYMNPTPEMQSDFKKMEGYTEMYQTGSREIYRVW